MRFLVDSALSPLVASPLTAAGYDTVHVRDNGMQDSSDMDILMRALDKNRVIISADTDFGEMLDKGCIVVFHHDRVRIRSLPVGG